MKVAKLTAGSLSRRRGGGCARRRTQDSRHARDRRSGNLGAATVQFVGRSYDFTIGGGGSSGFGIFSGDMLRMAKRR
jgi:hypothetical protein